MVNVSHTDIDLIIDSEKYKKNIGDLAEKINLDRIFKKHEKYHDLEVKALEKLEENKKQNISKKY